MRNPENMAKLQVKNRFGITPNEVLTHKDLTWKAKGLYGYIQSKPDGWTFSTERFEGKDGRDGTRAGVAELEDHGYLSRQKIRQPDGTWEIIYTLYETPGDNPFFNVAEAENHDGISVPDTNPTTTAFPTSEKPTSEIPATYKEISIKKEIEKKISFADFWRIYLKKENNINAEKKWNKLKEPEKAAVLEALQKVWNPYWVKKYGTAAGLPTDYIKAPDSWLHNRKWEEVPGKVVNIASTTPQPVKPYEDTAEEKKRKQEAKEAAEHTRKVEEFFKNLPEEEKQAIRDEAQAHLERITTEKSRTEYPKQAQYMKNGKIIQIVTEKYFSTNF